MKVHCIDCIYLKEGKCIKDSKNGYNNCKKYKAIPITELVKERKRLLVTGEDPRRLQFITEKITLFNGGTI